MSVNAKVYRQPPAIFICPGAFFSGAIGYFYKCYTTFIKSVNLKTRLIILTIFALRFDAITFCQANYSIEEQLGQSTIRIIVKKDTNNYVGTGFFFEFENEGLKKVVLITNSHLVTNTDTTILSFNKSIDGKPKYGDIVRYQIYGINNKWTHHPDTTIDLCYLELGPITRDAEKKKTLVFIRSIDEKLIPNDSLWHTFTYLEDVIMIGYPNGLIDIKNNLPIMRMGITASQPKLNFNNKPEFITDIANFKGSSGSPIFLRRIPFKMESKEKGKVSFGPRAEYYFVGVHYKGEYYDIIKNVTKSIKKESLDADLVQKYQVPLNIGHVIKSYEILDFKPLIFKK